MEGCASLRTVIRRPQRGMGTVVRVRRVVEPLGPIAGTGSAMFVSSASAKEIHVLSRSFGAGELLVQEDSGIASTKNRKSFMWRYRKRPGCQIQRCNGPQRAVSVFSLRRPSSR